MDDRFCVLTTSPRDGATLARRWVGGDGHTTVRSGNQKWTDDFDDAWLMDRKQAEEIAGNLRLNNPRFCRASKAQKSMTKHLT
jgi:hypothetical protein